MSIVFRLNIRILDFIYHIFKFQNIMETLTLPTPKSKRKRRSGDDIWEEKLAATPDEVWDKMRADVQAKIKQGGNKSLDELLAHFNLMDAPTNV